MPSGMKSLELDSVAPGQNSLNHQIGFQSSRLQTLIYCACLTKTLTQVKLPWTKELVLQNMKNVIKQTDYCILKSEVIINKSIIHSENPRAIRDRPRLFCFRALVNSQKANVCEIQRSSIWSDCLCLSGKQSGNCPQ